MSLRLLRFILSCACIPRYYLRLDGFQLPWCPNNPHPKNQHAAPTSCSNVSLNYASNCFDHRSHYHVVLDGEMCIQYYVHYACGHDKDGEFKQCATHKGKDTKCSAKYVTREESKVSTHLCRACLNSDKLAEPTKE